MSQRFVSFVADDFGVNPNRTDGILSVAFRLQHASALMNGRDVARAVNEARNVQLPVALHFNITEGKALVGTTIAGNPLVTGDGYFLSKAPCLCVLSAAEDDAQLHRRVEEAVAEQLTMQVAAFRTLAHHQGPVSLDGHHHVHVLPVVAIALAGCATRLGIGRIRTPFDPTLTLPHSLRFESAQECFGMPFWTRVSALGRTLQGRLPHLTKSDAFIGFDIMGERFTPTNLLAKLKSLPVEVVHVEVMTHCGLPCQKSSDDFGDDEFSQDIGRAVELRTLLSSTLDAVLREASFTISPR